MILSQVPSIRGLSAETWAAIVAAVGSALLVAKKLISRHPKPKPEYITRAEFHHELTAMRDRIGGSYLAIADKMDASHRELVATLERQSATFEQRLDRLEVNLARVDERTTR